MKFITPALATVAILALAQPAIATVFEPFAFAQLTAENTANDDTLRFGADAIRAGFRARSGAFTARLQLDFNAGDLRERPPGTLANVIKDVDVVYAFDERHALRFGQFKAPVGYDFLRPGFDLDIAKRGMEKALVLERALGVMLSGRKLANGFGYDLGVFNPAGRSGATRHIASGSANQVGDDLAAAGRVFFAPDEHWHAEVSLGMSQAAGGRGTADYGVLDAALRWTDGPWTLIGELALGTDVRGISGRDEQVWYAHAGYDLSPRVRGVLRHYSGTSDLRGVETDLHNTWLGVTFFFDPDKHSNARLMLNYVIAGGDERIYTGLGGFRDDALLAQFQFHYTAN